MSQSIRRSWMYRMLRNQGVGTPAALLGKREVAGSRLCQQPSYRASEAALCLRFKTSGLFLSRLLLLSFFLFFFRNKNSLRNKTKHYLSLSSLQKVYVGRAKGKVPACLRSRALEEGGAPVGSGRVSYPQQAEQSKARRLHQKEEAERAAKVIE